VKKTPILKFLFAVLAFSLTALVTFAATPTTTPELQRLQGKWEGSMVGDDAHQKVTITITGDSLHFYRDTNFWFKTTFTLPAGANPLELHATIKDCAARDSVGKVVVALFKFEDDTMILAPRGDASDDSPKNFEGSTRYELRKIAPQKILRP
jgi:uncharacterized protein (TIGR03067 family)